MKPAPPVREPEPRFVAMLMWLIVGLGFAAQLSRIVQVQSATGEVPFLSANDRSRWCTVAALAVTGSYEIDEVLEIRDPETRRRTWYTIDLVKHRGADGKQHFYSSKPPLLPTLYAYVYQGVRSVTGVSLMREPFFVARVMLVLVNLIPLLAFWWLMIHWAQQRQLSAWASAMLIGFVVWGCYLSTFVNTLNNHLPAAISVGISLYCISRLIEQKSEGKRWYILCGLSTAFGAANELPALSWVAAAAAILLIVNWRKTLLCFVPALLPVAAAFFAANYAAHGEFKPAYAHRNLGEVIAGIHLPNTTSIESLNLEACREPLKEAGIELSDSSEIRLARRPGVAELWDPASELRYGLTCSTDGKLQVYQWGDWYDYPGSYWTSDRKQGVDRGEPNRAKYIFHCLLGHHGIISLTPFWLVSIWGVWVLFRHRQSLNFFQDQRLLMMLAVVATSSVSILFYLVRPLEDCNYGGVSSGFRWAFWLAPLWLWLAMHGLQQIRSRWGRALAAGLLMASVFSATYPWANPWTSPWIMQWLSWLGWEQFI